MIRSTLGAPLGGTTRGGHQGFDSSALRLISPPKGSAGAGNTSPSIVVVALGEPGAPVICCAAAGMAGESAPATKVRPSRIQDRLIVGPPSSPVLASARSSPAG